MKIRSGFNKCSTVFGGVLCNNMTCHDHPIVTQTYMNHCVKQVCFPWLLSFESHFALLTINFQMLLIGVLCEDKYNIMNNYLEDCRLICDMCWLLTC